MLSRYLPDEQLAFATLRRNSSSQWGNKGIRCIPDASCPAFSASMAYDLLSLYSFYAAPIFLWPAS